MKKFAYIIGLALFALAWNGCGGDDDGGEEPGTPAVTWTLKSDIAGLDDEGMKAALSHVRVYLYDGEEKLLSVEKCASAGELKGTELEAGTYTAVLVGNVPDDGNITPETVGSALGAMEVVLRNEEGAA